MSEQLWSLKKGKRFGASLCENLSLMLELGLPNISFFMVLKP